MGYVSDMSNGEVSVTGRPTPTHYHMCPTCGEDQPSFRDKSRCTDPTARECGGCRSKRFGPIIIYKRPRKDYDK